MHTALAEAFELFRHAKFQLIIICKTASSRASFSGPRRWRMEMINSDCREGKGEQSTPPLPLPPLCTNQSVVWHCHAAEKLESPSVWLHPANLLF